jgi:hypothetical protein
MERPGRGDVFHQETIDRKNPMLDRPPQNLGSPNRGFLFDGRLSVGDGEAGADGQDDKVIQHAIWVYLPANGALFLALRRVQLHDRRRTRNRWGHDRRRSTTLDLIPG